MSFIMFRISVLKGQVNAKVLTAVQYIGILFVVINMVNMCDCNTEDQYLVKRQQLLLDEKNIFVNEMNFTEDEKKVNDYLLKLKKEELEESYHNFSEFLPAQNFLLSRTYIQQSKVFQFIKKFPKGASLHTHMLAGVNIDYVITNFTYMENVYGCENDRKIFKLKVLESPKQDGNCSWKSLKTYRKESSAKDFDNKLKSMLTLDADSSQESRETIWTKFKNTFTTLYDLVSYKPVFKAYINQLLEELYEDNVIYTELRGTFMPLYDLNGTTYDTKDFLNTLKEIVDEFKKNHSDFVGLKYIHSIYRGLDNDTFRSGLENLLKYKSSFQDLIAGLDFVGLEEDGRDLVDFHEELIGASKDLHFFFHAGETNQYGNTDLNLADAILLNSSRIGHAFALAKHPKLLEAAKQKNISIELSPISNQVLKLNDDPRNHPATVLLSQGLPVVICNDDPSVWGASGLSYDWYVVFMSMTWQDHGLEVLKKFAENSITHSALNKKEKDEAFIKWQAQWDTFIGEMANSIIP